MSINESTDIDFQSIYYQLSLATWSVHIYMFLMFGTIFGDMAARLENIRKYGLGQIYQISGTNSELNGSFLRF